VETLNETTTDAAATPRAPATTLPVRLGRRPMAGDSPKSLDPFGQSAGAIETRIAQLERQMADVRRLLVQPSAHVASFADGPLSAGPVVCCLGPFRFRLGGAPVDDWRSGKARALFQYLVNHCGQPIPRDTLIEALWPDPVATAPGTSLKVAVHLLRDVIARTRDTVAEKASLEIVSQGSCYLLKAADLWLDVEEFERCYALGRSRERQGQPTEALALYVRAAQLYRGDFLEDLADEWPTFRREALKDQYLFILTELAAAAVDAGDYQDGIVWCQRLLAKDRCREDTYRLLMLCHARLGQRSRVHSWYELCVRTLRTELDCSPEPETERVYRLALRGRL
jgi:DNA-binding SARP family transcriptional activator